VAQIGFFDAVSDCFEKTLAVEGAQRVKTDLRKVHDTESTADVWISLQTRRAPRFAQGHAHSRRFKISAQPESFLILFPKDRPKRRPMSFLMISTIVNWQQMSEFWESSSIWPNGCHHSRTWEEEQNGAREIQVGCHEGEWTHLHDPNTFEKVCRSQQVLAPNTQA
jgi:hypothetical protein